MKPDLFEKIDRTNDPYQIVKSALNSSLGWGFISALDRWLRGVSYGDEYAGCDFPEDDDQFKGIRCYFLDDEIIISEQVFFEHLRKACQRYIELHPDRKDKLEQIISKSSLR